MTGTAALIRADSGGLGHLTRDVARGVGFDRLLVVDVEPHRPPKALAPGHPFFEGASEVRWAILDECGDRRLGEWLTADVGVVWSAETFYSPALLGACLRRGVRPALYAMPELSVPGVEVDVRWPTGWRVPPGGIVLPLPDPEPLPWERRPRRRREGPLRVVHVCGPAMLDRQGTGVVVEALAAADVECEVVMVGADVDALPERAGRVRWVARSTVPGRWGLYDDVDVLVQPRRYGGLSMPVAEALAVGVDVIVSEWEPYAPEAVGTVRCAEGPLARMKGGSVRLWEPLAADLVEVLRRYAGRVAERREAPVMARAGAGWAGGLGAEWRAWLSG